MCFAHEDEVGNVLLQRELSSQHSYAALCKVCPCIIFGSLITVHQLKK